LEADSTNWYKLTFFEYSTFTAFLWWGGHLQAQLKKISVGTKVANSRVQPLAIVKINESPDDLTGFLQVQKLIHVADGFLNNMMTCAPRYDSMWPLSCGVDTWLNRSGAPVLLNLHLTKTLPHCPGRKLGAIVTPDDDL
jgi:hypothetical protein